MADTEEICIPQVKSKYDMISSLEAIKPHEFQAAFCYTREQVKVECCFMSASTKQTDAMLFYAQRLIALRNEAELSEPDVRRDVKTLEVGAVLALQSALLAWLNELATYLNYDGSEIISFEQFKSTSVVSMAEAQHLINLKLDPNSWLSNLFRLIAEMKGGYAGSAAGSSKQAAATVTESVPRNSIALVMIESEGTEAEAEVKLEQVLADFKAYLKGVRAHQIEW